ncbi:putative porin [Blattabacterium sp. DPU]|uniref:putative porin n=1 Tax=Blattabacterium sp. DPU TaxID=2715232 RepID=UPI001F61AA43|nr:putative porin [Blattabacterium sp. DPU]
MKEKIIKHHIDENQIGITEKVEFYDPTYQDYKFWTEEKNVKETFIEKDFSIKKYYSHNFFKYDNIGFFPRNGKDLFIPNEYQKLMQENFNEKMPKKMFFFKDPFFYREKIKYFDVKTPISEIFYVNDFLKKEKTLGGFFSQNFNEKTNYSIEYRNFHLENEPDSAKSKDLVLTTFNYQNHNDNDYDYKLWGHYIYQKFETKEKKEIKKWNIKNYKNILFHYNKLIHNRSYISFIQKIFSFKEKNRSLFLKTHLEYEKYYQDYLFQYLQKKINHFYLRNGLFLIFKQKKINIEVGSIFDKIHYQLFNNNYIKNKTVNSLSIQTKIHYPINDIYELYSSGKWIVENNNIQKYYFNTNVTFNVFLPKFLFFTQFSIDENDLVYNSFIPIYILKKNLDCYNNEQKNIFVFNRKKTINFSINKDKYYASFYISRLNRSYDEKSMEKFLYRKYIQLYGLQVETTHNIWKFQLNNILLYNKYNSDPLIFSIPNFLSRSTIFYRDNYFNKALFIQTGFSFYYFSKFYHQKISYPFQTFSFEKECIPNQIGGTPFVDYFLNFKIYRTIFYFKIQNIEFNNNNEFFIKTGFLWNLFT